MQRYAIGIFYSEEDGGYIAIAPELPGCSTFGRNEEEALREMKAAMALWLEAARREGRNVPKPSGKALFAAMAKRKKDRGARVSPTV